MIYGLVSVAALASSSSQRSKFQLVGKDTSLKGIALYTKDKEWQTCTRRALFANPLSYLLRFSLYICDLLLRSICPPWASKDNIISRTTTKNKICSAPAKDTS